MPRTKLITAKSDLAPEHQHVADAVTKVFGHIRGPFSVLLHSPTLAGRLVPMVSFVRDDIIVEPTLRFAAILTAARECDAPYVWAAQVAQARKHKVREDLIDHIRAQGDPAKLPAEERDVIDYTLQITRTHRAEEGLFKRLCERYGAQWLVELTATLNFFVFVAGIANAFEVEVPADGDHLPAGAAKK
jgi:4-carboxymuconolactone decarboxylase